LRGWAAKRGAKEMRRANNEEESGRAMHWRRGGSMPRIPRGSAIVWRSSCGPFPNPPTFARCTRPPSLSVPAPVVRVACCTLRRVLEMSATLPA
jgi:hypothetical protein